MVQTDFFDGTAITSGAGISNYYTILRVADASHALKFDLYGHEFYFS
jgi:hypothetical protein